MDIDYIPCRILSSHDDTFSTQIVVDTEQGSVLFLMRIGSLDKKNSRVPVFVREEVRVGVMKVNLCTKYPSPAITVAKDRIITVKEDGSEVPYSSGPKEQGTSLR